VNTTDRTGTSLRAFVDARAPLAAQRAALFTADLADQIAARHAEGVVQGALADSVRVRSVDGDERPVLGRPARSGSPDGDVKELGLLLAALLGVTGPAPDTPAPPGVPDPLWTVVTDAVDADRARRPPAAVLARRLRDATRDLLLGEVRWPSAVAPPDYVPGPDDAGEPDDAPAPARRHRLVLLTIGPVVLVVLVAVIVYAVVGDSGASGGDAGSPPPGSPGSSGPVGSSASAGPSVQACLNPNCVAQVVFRADTDQFSVCDKAKDGLSALAVFSRANQQGERSIWASNGEGTCVNQRVEVQAGTRITFKACTADRPQNRLVACSEPVTATA
jgi:hypothetical protein